MTEKKESFKEKIKKLSDEEIKNQSDSFLEIFDYNDTGILVKQIDYCETSYNLDKEELKRNIKLFQKQTSLKSFFSIEYRQSTRTIYILEMNKEGVFDIRKSYSKDLGKYYISATSPVISVPIILHGIYLTESKEKMYEVEIGNNLITYLNKRDLIKEIKEKNTYSRVYTADLKIFIDILLSEQERIKKIKTISMYPTIGIFLNNNELTVVYPGLPNIKVYGENDVQKRLIERVSQKGLDLNGNLIKAYYNIFKVKKNSVPEICKFISMGHTLIEVFFEALSEHLTILPNLFWFNKKFEIGKTVFLEVVNDYLFGTELKSQDTIDSISRYTLFSTESTISLHFDDLDKLPDKTVSFIKSSSTRRQSRIRLRRDSTVKEDPILNSFIGSGNYDTIISGPENQAFRDRCFVLRQGNDIDSANTKIFDDNFSKIKSSKVLGPYVLQQSIDFINATSKEKKSSLEKLKELIERNKQKIIFYLKKNNIKLPGPRRIIMYALNYTGLQLWKYNLDQKNLVFKELEEVLNLNSNIFLGYIKILEIETSIPLFEEIEKIISFYEQQFQLPHISNDGRREFKDLRKGKRIFVQADFTGAYDEKAKRRGYSTLNTLQNLADIESVLLNEEITPKKHYFIDRDEALKESERIGKKLGKEKIKTLIQRSRCVEFKLNELKEIIGLKTKPKDTVQLKLEVSEDNLEISKD